MQRVVRGISIPRFTQWGGADQTTLLESERTFHRYLDEFRRSQMESYRGYTALFLALGGGVKHGEVLPGGGRRPAQNLSGKVITPQATVVSPIKPSSVEGLDIAQGGFGFSSGADQAFWQVELPGLYHRNTVGAAWRDLRVRYPQDMDRRMVRPRLNGRIDDSAEGQEAWYRLFIAKFDSAAEAQEFCDRMQANLERCRVVNAKGEESARVELKQERVRLAAPVESSSEMSQVPASASVSAPSLVIPDSKPKATQRDSASGRQAQTIQLAAFSNLENAAISTAVWQFRGYEVYVAETRGGDGRLWYSVRTGIFPNQGEAAAAVQQIRRKEEAPALLVPIMLDATGLPASIDVSEVLTLKKDGNNSAVLPEPPEAPLITSSPVPGDGIQLKSALSAPPVIQKPKTNFAVQLGAFSSLENAEVSSKYWQDRGLNIYINQVRDAEGRAWFAVRTGEFVQRREASALAVQLGRKENVSAIVVSVAVDVEKEQEKLKSVAAELLVAQPAVPGRAIPVKADVVKAELPNVAQRPRYAIQLGVYGNIENAAKAFAEWQLRGYEPYVCETGGLPETPRFAVRTGDFSNKREAQAMVRTIERQEGSRGLVVTALIDSKGGVASIDVTPLLKSGTTAVPENVNLTNGR